jgi:hypothetical protein
MKQIYLIGVKYGVRDTMEIRKITGQKELGRAQLVPSITTLHIAEIQADHVDDGSKAGAD